MKISKRTVKRWIQTSIEVCSLLSAEPFKTDIETGNVVLFCPSEVIDLLRRKRLLTEVPGKTYFEYQGAFGITFVEVRKDAKERSGLFLEKKAE